MTPPHRPEPNQAHPLSTRKEVPHLFPDQTASWEYVSPHRVPLATRNSALGASQTHLRIYKAGALPTTPVPPQAKAKRPENKPTICPMRFLGLRGKYVQKAYGLRMEMSPQKTY